MTRTFEAFPSTISSLLLEMFRGTYQLGSVASSFNDCLIITQMNYTWQLPNGENKSQSPLSVMVMKASETEAPSISPAHNQDIQWTRIVAANRFVVVMCFVSARSWILHDNTVLCFSFVENKRNDDLLAMLLEWFIYFFFKGINK